MTAIVFSTSIGPVPINCVVSEKHSSGLELTEIPLESGSKITDHAYLKPKSVVLDIATANAAASFNALVRFQESRVPFVLVTGLTIYKNMMIKSIDPERDASFSTVLRGRVELQEIIIVGTSYATDPAGEGTQTSKAGKAGGEKSRNAAALSPERAKDSVTADRVTGTVQRGDAGAVTVPATQDQSIIRGVFQ